MIQNSFFEEENETNYEKLSAHLCNVNAEILSPLGFYPLIPSLTHICVINKETKFTTKETKHVHDQQ